MDMYFEVGELPFPKGRASLWLETVLPETDRDAEDRRTALAQAIESLLGDDAFRAALPPSLAPPVL